MRILISPKYCIRLALLGVYHAPWEVWEENMCIDSYLLYFRVWGILWIWFIIAVYMGSAFILSVI